MYNLEIEMMTIVTGKANSFVLITPLYNFLCLQTETKQTDTCVHQCDILSYCLHIDDSAIYDIFVQ